MGSEGSEEPTTSAPHSGSTSPATPNPEPRAHVAPASGEARRCSSVRLLQRRPPSTRPPAPPTGAEAIDGADLTAPVSATSPTNADPEAGRPRWPRTRAPPRWRGHTPDRPGGPRPTTRRTARTGRAGHPPPGRERPPPAGTDEDRARSPDAWRDRRWPRRGPEPPRRGRVGPPEATRWPRRATASPTRADRWDRSPSTPVRPSRTTRSLPPRRSGSCRRRGPEDPTVDRRRTSGPRRRRAPTFAGPARSPSFVTWPVRSMAMPSSLASPTSASVHRRTWDGPPGICVPDVSRMVWMESTASKNGRVSRAVSSTCARSRPGANEIASPETPSLRARAATCAWDSSPDTNTHVRPAPERCASTWSRSVDLPMPGSPASNATDAGTTPPPSTRSMPANPVETRRSSSGAEAKVTSDGGLPERAAVPLAARTSSMVPH